MCSAVGGVRTRPGTRSGRERFKSPASRGNGKEGAAGLHSGLLSLATAVAARLLIGKEKKEKRRQERLWQGLVIDITYLRLLQGLVIDIVYLM